MTTDPTRRSAERAAIFKALHARDGIFLIPNPWDVGTARMLAALGFEALATTSAGHAFSLGQDDNTLTREATLAHAREIVAATDLPVSADLGNGFGDDPDAVAETIRLAGETGLAGASVEDATNQDARPVYESSWPSSACARRVRSRACVAGAAGAHGARRELHRRPPGSGRHDQEAAGVSGRGRRRALRAGTEDDRGREDGRASGGPAGERAGRLGGAQFTMADLAAAGVRRVSTGSALARAALGEFLRGVTEMRETGTFGFVDRAASSKEIARLLSR